MSEVKFEHRRKDFIQAVYGNLAEEPSFHALEECEKRLEEIFEEINTKNDEAHAQGGSQLCLTEMAEIAYRYAKTEQEKIIFLFKVGQSTAQCGHHPLMGMMGMLPTKDA